VKTRQATASAILSIVAGLVRLGKGEGEDRIEKKIKVAVKMVGGSSILAWGGGGGGGGGFLFLPLGGE